MKLKKVLSNIFAYLIVFAFMACSVHAAQSAVNLGTSGNFVILAKTGISTTGVTSIVGDIGVSPAAASYITGFELILDSSNQFAASSIVTGKVYAADYEPLTPTVMTAAISDMQTAYTDAAGRTLPDYNELGAGNIGGMTLAPGLYKWSTGVTIPTDVTLSGSSNDVWIFQIAQDLDISSGKQVILSGGARARNIFWQVAGQATLATTSVFNGNILSQTAIVLNTGSTLKGRALAQTAVTLDSNDVSLPAGLMSGSGLTSGTVNQKPIVKSNSSGSGEVDRANGQQPSSNEDKTILAVQNDSKNKILSVEKNQTDLGIGQELSEQIRERKEEIESGEYYGPLGQLMMVRQLAQNLKELRVNGVNAQTDLNITADTDSNGKTKLKVMLKNGQKVEIKIMPDTASENALAALGLKVCSPDKNCTIQLKDVGSGETEKIQYEVQLERHSRILGIFQKKMQVSVDVEAETGDARVHKPWWAFMAAEPSE